MSEDPVPTTISSGEPLDASSRPAGASAPTNVPDLMKIGAVPTNTLMDVESDILEPVVQSQSFCRFRLQNKGILHSNSKLTFAVDGGLIAGGGGAGNDNAFFPINVGVNSLIDRCVLKSGTKTLCETDGYNQFMAYRSMFINPQHNKQREAFTTGRMMCRCWQYNDGAAGPSEDGANVAAGEQSDSNAVGYTLDTGVETERLNALPAARIVKIPDQCYVTTRAVDRAPVYQIALNDLFPFLKMNQLPLYMCKEELDIELHFATAPFRLCINGNDAVGAQIVANETKMIADYIYYPQEMMDAYANANRKLAFTYVDYRRVRHTVTAVAGVANTVILNLGGAGRIVNKVFFCTTAAKGANPERSLLNDFTADGLQTTLGGGAAARTFGTLTHNIRYNDNYLYPVDITNPSRVVDNITQAEGSPPFVSKDEWSQQESLITLQQVESRQLEQQIRSTSMWTCDRLNRNERINSRGIELYATWDTLENVGDHTLNAWLELVRYAVLEDGQFTVTWA